METRGNKTNPMPLGLEGPANYAPKICTQPPTSCSASHPRRSTSETRLADRQIRSMQEELDRAGHHRRPLWGSAFALRIEEDGVLACSRICRASSGTLLDSDTLEGHRLAGAGRDVVILQVGIHLGREEGMVREQ
jgi:hypothetical protein